MNYSTLCDNSRDKPILSLERMQMGKFITSKVIARKRLETVIIGFRYNKQGKSQSLAIQNFTNVSI